MANDDSRSSGPLRGVLIGLVAVLSVILCGAVVIAVVLSRVFSSAQYVDSATQTTVSSEIAESIRQEEYEPTQEGQSSPSVDVSLPPLPEGPDNQAGQGLNILLIGQDRREGESQQRSDSMILVTFDRSSGGIALTSILRDQYVSIPGYGNDKLCHAYQYGGMPLLDRVLYEHYGIRVDGNIEVDFSGFEGIIDMLGGVEVELTEREAAHLNRAWGWDLHKGDNLLTGAEALSYARLRAIDNDYQRARRQQKVLLSMFEKYRGQSLSALLELAEETMALVKTDMDRKQIMGHVMAYFDMISGATVRTARIPADGTFSEGYIQVSEGYRMWCQYNIDFEENREQLRQIFAN